MLNMLNTCADQKGPTLITFFFVGGEGRDDPNTTKERAIFSP